MKELGFETKAVRLQSQQTHQKEHSVPLYLTSSFTFDDAAEGAAIFAGEAEETYTVVLAIPTRTNLPIRLQRLKALNLQWLRPVG